MLWYLGICLCVLREGGSYPTQGELIVQGLEGWVGKAVGTVYCSSAAEMLPVSWLVCYYYNLNMQWK